ncbi:hypothetical protein H072_8545 [Dactylellina haptotyla CBS 200.50]|uniref:Uncharacterized protein n=1 Tax=Dactylellina haptotyla (strain CBS 200.50) TaxID=1284197 RepID=S8A3U8_DACHA|nr:hypothetical protein H072_8545 [Dactylellina haptotyla CBS 200.50]
MKVQSSELDCKEAMAAELGGFIKRAKPMVRKLSRFSAKVNTVVDIVIANDNYALKTLTAIQARQSPGRPMDYRILCKIDYLGMFCSKGTPKQDEEDLKKAFIQATSSMVRGIPPLVKYAEMLLQDLEALETGLEAIADMAEEEKRTGQAQDPSKIPHGALAKLWENINGETFRQMEAFKGHSALLERVGEYQKDAMGVVVETLATLTSIQANMEDFMDLRTQSAFLNEDTPSEVHMEIIRAGTEYSGYQGFSKISSRIQLQSACKMHTANDIPKPPSTSGCDKAAASSNQEKVERPASSTPTTASETDKLEAGPIFTREWRRNYDVVVESELISLNTDEYHLCIAIRLPHDILSPYGEVRMSRDGTWNPSYPVSSRGTVKASGKNAGIHSAAAATVLRGEEITTVLKSTGRLFNPINGLAVSGFWLEGGFFITTLHFARWNQSERPTDSELQPYLNGTREILACSESFVDIGCSDMLPEVVELRLVGYIIESDLAVFRATNCFYQPLSWISYDCIIESDLLEQLPVKLSNTYSFSVGYNSSDFSELDEYIRKYQQETESTLTGVLDYQSLFHPNHKTVSCGSILEHNDKARILIKGPSWKGYSGGPIVVRVPGKSPRIVVVGDVREGFVMKE